MADVTVAIIGSGPAGISAATRAAALGISHVLVERAAHVSDTISKYQRGKYIMSTPDRLPLRAELPFQADTREAILERWTDRVRELGVNLHLNTEVTGIEGERGSFTIHVSTGESFTAEYVVLAIGLQGNLRKLEVPGAGNGLDHYQLDDPAEFWDKDIVVIGAGDAAIENAVALSQNENRVTIVNRSRDFARAKSGNRTLIMGAIKDEQITCIYNATPARIEAGAIVLDTAEGEEMVRCDRVIARLGAIAPRKFVEKCGGVFDPGADYPRVSESYESDRPGLFIVGALAGYPLIKNCLNQGYEVIQTIAGDPVENPEVPILRKKFEEVGLDGDVTEILAEMRDVIPVFSGLTILQLREFLLEAEIVARQPGESFIEKGAAGDSLFLMFQGAAEVGIGGGRSILLPRGTFFGEMGLIMGRRRSATVTAAAGQVSLAIEVPRMSALKLLASSATAKKAMNDALLTRRLQTFLSPDLTPGDIGEILATYEIKRFARGETLMIEGEVGDAVYLIQSGSVAVTRLVGGKETIIGYAPAGQLVGEGALIAGEPRNATVRAAVGVEAIRIDASLFRALMSRNERLRQMVARIAQERALGAARRSTLDDHATRLTDFMVHNGLGEATNAIVIDTKLCVGCDQCEKACAETHDGIPRLDREAGPTYADIHIPLSCRHCEHPHCMADCPPNALYRTASGAVSVNDETCIGCGNCARNCPYDAIRLSAKPKKRGLLLTWLLFGFGDDPGQRGAAKKSLTNKELARKCDLCESVGGHPACVRACPTGAVIRLAPETLMDRVQGGK